MTRLSYLGLPGAGLTSALPPASALPPNVKELNLSRNLLQGATVWHKALGYQSIPLPPPPPTPTPHPIPPHTQKKHVVPACRLTCHAAAAAGAVHAALPSCGGGTSSGQAQALGAALPAAAPTGELRADWAQLKSLASIDLGHCRLTGRLLEGLDMPQRIVAYIANNNSLSGQRIVSAFSGTAKGLAHCGVLGTLHVLHNMYIT